MATTDSADSVPGTDAAPDRPRAGWRCESNRGPAVKNGRQDMTTTETNPIDQARLEAFVGQERVVAEVP